MFSLCNTKHAIFSFKEKVIRLISFLSVYAWGPAEMANRNGQSAVELGIMQQVKLWEIGGQGHSHTHKGTYSPQ